MKSRVIAKKKRFFTANYLYSNRTVRIMEAVRRVAIIATMQETPVPGKGCPMGERPTPRVVAVLDSDPDTTEMLKTWLEFEGMIAATGSLTEFRLGKEDLISFLTRIKPDVILYDVGVPYEANYLFLQKMRADPAFPHCGIVLTTTNAHAVETLLGVRALELMGKPYDLSRLSEAVRSATWSEDPVSPPRDANIERRNGERRASERRSGRNRRAAGPPVH
jgi:CheY-like chemotaxis protein